MGESEANLQIEVSPEIYKLINCANIIYKRQVNKYTRKRYGVQKSDQDKTKYAQDQPESENMYRI